MGTYTSVRDAGLGERNMRRNRAVTLVLEQQKDREAREGKRMGKNRHVRGTVTISVYELKEKNGEDRRKELKKKCVYSQRWKLRVSRNDDGLI